MPSINLLTELANLLYLLLVLFLQLLDLLAGPMLFTEDVEDRSANLGSCRGLNTLHVHTVILPASAFYMESDFATRSLALHTGALFFATNNAL